MAEVQVFDSSELPAVKVALDNTRAAMAGVVQQIAIGEIRQTNFAISIEKGQEAAGGLQKKIAEVVKTYANWDTAKKVLEFSDAMSVTTAKLSAMKGEMGSVDVLQNDIYRAAQSCGTSYMDMADTVTQLGQKAGGVFQSGDEMVQYAQNLNKSFAVAGLSQEEMASSTEQMLNALGAGGLDSSGFETLSEAAPGMLQDIADYMGQPIEKMKELAAEGQVTSEVLKNSLLGATGDINTQFGELPTTFAQVGSRIQNAAALILQPLLLKINEIAQNESFNTVVNSLLNGLNMVGAAAGFVLGLLIGGAVFIIDNWSVIAPILLGAAGAVLIFLAATQGAALMANGISAAIKAWTVVQGILNAVMAMNPLSQILLIIIIVIAAVYAIVAAINRVTGTTTSATGVIFGAFSAVAAVIYNVYMGVLDFVMGLISYFINKILVFANFFANVFKNPVSSIVYLFQGLADNVLGFIEKIAAGIDMVFKTNMAGVVAGWRADLKTNADLMVEKYAPNETYENVAEMTDLGIDDLGLAYKSATEAYDKGYKSGEKAESGVKDLFKGTDYGAILGDSKDANRNYEVDPYGGPIEGTSPYQDNGMAENMNQTAANTGRMADSAEMSEEDLGYLKDSAEREVIDRTVFSNVNVNMGGINNTVKNVADMDNITDYLVLSLKEQLAISAEGVY